MSSTNSYSKSYKEAGVDVTAGYRSVELIKEHVARTNIPGVVSGIGGFGGLFEPDFSGMKTPTLVSGTDGVGTKLKIAFLMDKHDTVGIDCVAMCANDVACSGAQPLFFLDYLAVGKNIPEKIAEIVSGVAEGLADKEKIVDCANVKAGDTLIGVASTGLHSNGFSLVRSTLPPSAQNIHTHIDEFGKTLGEELITPTRIYVKSVLALQQAVKVHGISNITGGGFYENIPRMLPDGMMARVERKTVKVLPVFDYIQKMSDGKIDDHDMFNTFNMGVGLVVAVDPSEVDIAIATLKASGEDAYVIGEVIHGTEGVKIC